jgi:hypothetical protein
MDYASDSSSSPVVFEPLSITLVSVESAEGFMIVSTVVSS